jgi:hypothetical protein
MAIGASGAAIGKFVVAPAFHHSAGRGITALVLLIVGVLGLAGTVVPAERA